MVNGVVTWVHCRKSRAARWKDSKHMSGLCLLSALSSFVTNCKKNLLENIVVRQVINRKLKTGWLESRKLLNRGSDRYMPTFYT